MYDVFIQGLSYFDRLGIKIYAIILTSSNNCSDDIWDSFMKLLEEIKKIYKNDVVDWFAVETDEGNGTIHLFINKLMFVEWYKEKWYEIHNSYYVRQVQLKDFNEDNYDGLGVYISTQYSILRCECSDNWIKQKGKVYVIDDNMSLDRWM